MPFFSQLFCRFFAAILAIGYRGSCGYSPGLSSMGSRVVLQGTRQHRFLGPFLFSLKDLEFGCDPSRLGCLLF